MMPTNLLGRLSGVATPASMLLLLVSSVACQSGPSPAHYLLEPAQVIDVEASALSLGSLGLATVALPGYVKDSAVTRRSDEGARLLSDERAHWAESPDASMTRVLAESLRIRSGADVLIEPLPRGFDPGARIEIIFDELLGNATGGADMAGQVRLISGDGRSLEDVFAFQLSHRGSESGQAAFFEAVSQGLDDLARLLVQRLAGAPA